MNYKTLSFALKAIDDGAGFEGHAAVFGNVDRVGDIIVPGAFKETIPQFLDAGVVVWQHDWRTPIGKPLEAREDEKGFFIKATLCDTTQGRDARTLMKEGIVKKLSFGYDILDAEKISSSNIAQYCDPATVEPRYLEQAFKWGWILKRLHVYEVSPVSVPANPEADITGVKAGPLSGRTLDDHSVAVLTAVGDYAKRLEDLRELKAEKGGELSGEHRARIEALARGLDQAKGRLDALLAEPAGESAPDPEAQKAALNAHASFLEFESRLLAGAH